MRATKTRKFFNSIKDKANTAVITVKTAIASKKAEGYVDTGVKILIAVVIGALLLGGTYTLVRTGVLEPATNKVRELFNYGANNNANNDEEPDIVDGPGIIGFSIEGVVQR